ncbi:MAG: DUF4232 domain-containing protein [Streptosporangiaceae bacterium]
MRRLFIGTGAVATAVVSAVAITSFATAATARPAATRSAAVRAAATTPACTAADLGAWVAADQGNGAAGTIYYPLEFTNLSRATCSLTGYPGVSALSRSGRQLGLPARWGTAKPKAVTLAPGATAHAVLAYSDATVGSYPPADQAIPVWLRIYPPGQRSSTHAFWNAPGLTIARSYLTVSPIQAGVGTIYNS